MDIIVSFCNFGSSVVRLTRYLSVIQGEAGGSGGQCGRGDVGHGKAAAGGHSF
jgi:hypothetical protein